MKPNKVVIAGGSGFLGSTLARNFHENGVEVVVLDDLACVEMMAEFIAASPGLWNEDIGVPG